MSDESSARGVALQLLACSFLALFLELMLIRWVPAALPTVAYYANLLLVTSFFGLGLGALLAGRRSLFGWFPAALLGDVLLILLAQRLGIALEGADEVRFRASAGGGGAATGPPLLALIFAANACVFVPIGQRIGELFACLPPLRGYAFDLGGSLAGTVAFAVFSHGFFSPVVGAAIPMALHAALGSWRQRAVTAALGAATLGLMGTATSSSAIWSPYYYITIRDHEGRPAPEAPPPDLRSMQRPPAYSVAVNHTFYQFHGSLDPARYVAEGGAPVLPHADLYAVPHAVRPGARTTLVLGSGGGLDVEAALLRGSAEVDAVDIDPGLIAIARRWSANGVYDDPRARVHVDDARAYLERDDRLYDCVTFGYLDSQALSSSMSNVRLDGYVYTIEGLRAGWRRVATGGVLSVAFFVGGQHWLAERLVHLVRAATGQEPVLYSQGVHLVALVGRGPLRPPEAVGAFRRLDGLTATGEAVTLPTDDWPFLYLRRPGVPRDYLVVLGLLAAAIVGAVLWVRPPGQVTAADAQSSFLGAGFLLLETKSITDCAIYFGGTWLVTTAVVAGVLVMVLAANALAASGRGRPSWLALLAALVVVAVVPRGEVLALPPAVRLAWVVLVVPLPLLFAGLIFSDLFRSAARPASLFGANLVGATLAGLCEYGSMAVGGRALSLVILLFYGLAWACARRRRGTPPAPPG